MRIKGNTVGFPNPQPNWNQTDEDQADFILNKPPISISSDGYTDIDGLRQLTEVTLVKNQNNNTIGVMMAFQGDELLTSMITLNEDNYPVKIVTGDVECTIGWEGFD